MTQEKQGSNLEERLIEIGSINSLGKSIDKSKSPEERFQLYHQLALSLSHGNAEDYKSIYGDIRISPEEALRYSKEATISRAKELEQIYKENKSKILNEVSSIMNKNISSAKNKAEAASILSPYFEGLINVPEIDQATLDEYEQEGLAKRIGVSMNFSAKGNKEKYESLQYRMVAGGYIKENSKDGNITYNVDKDKLAETINEILPGAIIYSNAKNIKKEAEKAKKK